MNHHIIFEGAELAGKSFVMSQAYNYLEPKYRTSKNILDGCHWFNTDIGIFGTKYGKSIINGYLEIFQTLNEKNIITEKFHISDIVYNRLYNNKEINYSKIEKELEKLNFKLILICLPENIEKIEKRIKDRLNLYPHYKEILKSPSWYIKQQEEYKLEFKKSKLKKLLIQTDILPDPKIQKTILDFINE